MGLGDLPQAVVREPKALLHGDNCLISGEDLLWQALLCVCVCVFLCGHVAAQCHRIRLN